MFLGFFALAILTVQVFPSFEYPKSGKNPYTSCSDLKSSSNSDDKAIEAGENYYLGCHDNKEAPYTIYVGTSASPIIGQYAFYDCQDIGVVNIRDSVTSIGKGAFSKCFRLTAVNILTRTAPASTLSLAEGAFYRSSITQFNSLRSFITSVGKLCFAECTNFESTFKLSIEDRENDARLYIQDAAFYKSNIQLQDNQIIQKGTAISDYAFQDCEKIGQITFAGSKLGEEAFRGCKNLKLKFNSNSPITTISDKAFFEAGTIDVSKPTLPKNLLFIKPYAFYNTQVIGNPGFPRSLTQIGMFAFKGTGITGNLDFTYVEVIGESAFEGTEISGALVLTNMKQIGAAAFKDTGVSGELVIYPFLTQIDGFAFYNTKISGSLTIPSTVTIGDYAFANCPGITENIKIEGTSSRPKIGLNAFEGLSFKTLDVSKITIASKAFMGATITTVNIEDSIVDINAFLNAKIDDLSIKGPQEEYTNAVNAYGFENCQIKSILLTDVNLAQNAFRELSKETKPTLTFDHDILNNPDGDYYVIGSKAFFDTPISGSLKILNTTKTVGSEAFAFCTNLNGDLDLNASTIENGAFTNCQFAGTLTIDSHVSDISISNDIDIEINTFSGCPFKTLILKNTEGAPPKQFKIPKKAFYRMTSLTGTVTIPKTVTGIGDQAFMGCDKFDELVFQGDSTSSLTIGQRAFYKCSAISKSFSIERDISTISDFAFYGCTSLTTINLPNTLETINSYAFANSGLKSIQFPKSVTTIQSSAFEECSRLSGDLVLPEGVTTINQRTFYNCQALTRSLTIGKDVSSIDHYAFYQCKFTGNLNLPTDHLYKIGNGAFQGCSGLTGPLNIDGVTSLGYDAFNGCSGLSGPLVFDNSLVIINHHAFYQCTSLTGPITFPSSLTTINHNAFNGCTKLTGPLDFPSSLSTIGDHAFEGCSGLTSISFDSKGATNLGSINIDSIGAYAFNGCSGLTGPLNLKKSGGMTKIDDYAFSGCSGLNGPLYLNDVKLIGNYAFSGCSGFSDSLMIIVNTQAPIIVGRGAFKDCKGFKDGTLTVFIEKQVDDDTDADKRYTQFYRHDYFLRIGNEAFENTKFKNVYYSGRFEPDCDTDIGLSGKIKTSTEYANKTFCGKSVRGKGGLSGGAIAGIVIACVVVVAVIVFLIVFFLLRKKGNDKSEAEVEMNQDP